MSKKSGLSRRAIVAAGATALAAPYLLRRAEAKADTLRLLTWEGYADAAWVKPFEEKTGAKCNIVYVGSADEMFAKMQGSKGADFCSATIKVRLQRQSGPGHAFFPRMSTGTDVGGRTSTGG